MSPIQFFPVPIAQHFAHWQQPMTAGVQPEISGKAFHLLGLKETFKLPKEEQKQVLGQAGGHERESKTKGCGFA